MSRAKYQKKSDSRNKKFTIAVAVILAVLILAGCGKKTTTNTTTTATDDYFPGVDRSTTVNPSGQTLTSDQQNDQLVANRETIQTNLKIGSTTQIKINKVSLSGIVRILSTTGVGLENFTYNGQCPAFAIYLTRSNNTTLAVVPFNLTNRAYNSENLKINFPQGTSINNVDSVAIICNNTKEPLLVERLGQ